MKRKKIKLTPSEIRAHIGEQARFLRASCKAFDVGDEAEAKRLATTIRVLVHTTQKSRSLLHQAGSAFRWRMADSAFPFNPDNLLSHHGLVAMKIANTPPIPSSKYVPKCEAGESFHDFIQFGAWWDAIVFKDKDGNTFSRRDIVLAVANQDGGAHVDPELDEDYAGLSKGNTLGWRFSIGDQEAPFPDNPVPPSVRQIAHEVLVTLEAAGLVEREIA